MSYPLQQTVAAEVFKVGSAYHTRRRDGTSFSHASVPTTVIQNAIDNLTPGRTWKEVVKLTGNFPGISQITLPSYTVLDAREARLVQASAQNQNFIRNSDFTNGNDHIELWPGIIDGNKTGQSAGGDQYLQSMIHFQKCSNVLIKGGQVQFGDFHNIVFKNCLTDITVDGITSYDPRHEHLSSHSPGQAHEISRGHKFINNYFENISAGNSHITTINVSDCIIANNICNRTFDTTSCVTPNGLRTIVANNTIINGNHVGIILAQSTSDDFDASGSIVIGNLVKDCNGYGIVSNGRPQSGLIVVGNRVEGGGTSQSAGIYLAMASNSLIANNIVSSKQGNGIYVLATTANLAKRVKVIGNVCFNNGQSVAGGNHQAGIQLFSLNASGDLSYVTVENNQCYDDQGTKTQLYGVRASNVTESIIKNNDLRDNSTAGFITGGTVTGTIAKDNRGYITESFGTATIASGATSIAVNHGLNITPSLSNIQVTPTNDMGNAAKYWISTPTSTQFTINVNIDPGATTATFVWSHEL